MAYYLAALEMLAGLPTALTTLRTALDTYGADSLLAAGGSRRLPSLTGAANVAAFYGALPEHERVLEMVTKVEPRLPGANVPTRWIASMWRAAARLALGLDSPQIRRTVDSSLAVIDRLTSGIAPTIQAQSRGLAFLAYLTTKDTSYIAPLRRWGSKRVPSEVEALLALDAGDTTRAAAIAARFPAPDSARLVSDAGSGFAQFAQAEIFARLGNFRRSIAIYESIQREDLGLAFGSDPRWPLYARSFLARGQLYEQLGDRPRAVAAYEEFLEIWKEAAPELRDQLRVAREGIIRLRDAPAQSVP
jgi:tetratricopeptide (TPR) repeat protein